MAIRYSIVRDRAIKKYLNSIGFEYVSKQYSFYKKVCDDIEYMSKCTSQFSGRKGSHEVCISVFILHSSWLCKLQQLTDGEIDLRKIGMMRLDCAAVRELSSYYSMIFTADRTLEENIAEFKHIIETNAMPFWERYSSKEYLYKVAPYWNNWLVSSDDCYFLPIVCFEYKDYDGALKFLRIFKYLYKQGAIKDKDMHFYNIYKVLYKNMQKLIRQESGYCAKKKMPLVKYLWRRLTIR